MKFKRMMSVLLVIILTMSVFAGCTKEELSFYNLYKDLNEFVLTKPVHHEGKISLSLDSLSPEMFESDMDNLEIEFLNAAIVFSNKYNFVFTMDSDVKNNKTIAQFEVNSNDSDESIPLMTVIRNGDTTYIKLDDYVQVIKDMTSSFVTEEESIQLNEEIDSLYDGVEYISISDEELIAFYTELLGFSLGSVEGELIAKQLKRQLDVSAMHEETKAELRFVDYMLDEVYSDYSMDIVEKEENKYSITLDVNNLGDTVAGFLDYSIENSEDFVDAISEYVLNLSDEEYSLLAGAYAIDMINKELLVDGLKAESEAFSENKDQYQKELEEALALYNCIFKTYIKGSMLTFTLGEKDDVFTRDTMLKWKVNDINNESVPFDATITINETFEEIDTFDIEIPTDNVETFTELMARMPKTMKIYLDYDLYVMSTNTNMSQDQFDYIESINIIIKDGASYLPARIIAEEFDETIGWDNKVKKPYLLIEGEKLYMNEFIIVDSVAYVKVREFENFGYTVRWDGETRLITIEK